MAKLTDSQAARLEQMIPLAEESSTEVEDADTVFPEVALWVVHVLWLLKHEDKNVKTIVIELAVGHEISMLGVELLRKRGWNASFIQSDILRADHFQITRP